MQAIPIIQAVLKLKRKGDNMTITELSREIYNHVNTIRKPFDQAEVTQTLRWVIEMIEDGLKWKEIKEHLTKGCNCSQVKSKEEFERLEKGG